MRPATKADFPIMNDILFQSFEKNISSNYVLKEPYNSKYLKRLINYSIKSCEQFGWVFLNEDKTGCALVLDPKQSKGLKGLTLDLYFVFQVAGISKVPKILKREGIIKSHHKKYENALHLWFIGVNPKVQHKGVGTKLLQEVIGFADGRQLILETSNPENLPWYKNNGFTIYATEFIENHELHFLANK